MAKDPAFLFYSSDFLAGVTDLTMEERGQYITLLCLQHQKGHLSEKTTRLAVGSVSVDVLQKFKTDAAGLLYNERLEEEINKRLIFSESRRINGLKGGRKKASAEPSGLPIDLPNGLPKNNLPENENTNDNELELQKKDFLIKAEKFDREQPPDEMEFRKAREYIAICKMDASISLDWVKSQWPAFVIHAEKKYYAAQGAYIQHFRDWMKGRKVEKQLDNSSDLKVIPLNKDDLRKAYEQQNGHK